MPPRNRNRRRTDRRPNVFVQTERSAGRSQTSDEPEAENAAVVVEPSPVLAATSVAVARQRPVGARRTQRTRSEVYARTFPLEIRKMAILSTGIVVALAVFTFVL